MSLLIKALEKAEQGKAADGTAELSLQSYPQAGETDSTGTAQSDQAGQKLASQQVAAKVFSAKTKKNNHKKKDKLLWLALAALLLLIIIGIQFYLYLNTLKKPEVILLRPPQQQSSPAETPLAQDAGQVPAATPESTPPATSPASPATADVAGNSHDTLSQVVPTVSAGKSAASAESSVFGSRDGAGRADTTMDKPASPATDVPALDVPARRAAAKQAYVFGEPPDTSGVPVRITRSQPENAINPALLAAYQAFSSGDDVAAQRNYRQVLRSDARNVDALLGMAAIAARQGRNNDAMGWYGKVLEVEPRNSVAQAAMVNLLAQADPVSSESRIKSLIAQQPEAAHLHASLGNLYAEQNQWPSAQQAYFQAHHFAPNNAEYAFNLAVSLEQLGKPTLALPYYQRALDLLNSREQASTGAVASGATIDRAQLESRIRQLQQ